LGLSLTMMNLKATLIQATEAAGEVLKTYFNGTFEVTSKGTINDLVTEVDKKAEAVIIQTIKAAFPDHYILSEEAGALAQDSPYKWIIDPIDGTVNFAHGIPLCCVSIGLEFNGEMILGAVYNPFMQEFFFAQKGFGATLNDKKISVSKKDSLETACLVTGFPYNWADLTPNPLEIFARFIEQGVPVRRLGSAAIDLCWVAAGRFDGFYEQHLSAWDTAAGFLIVQEAGGKVTDYTGQPYSPHQPRIIATNGLLHDALLKTITG
jgi:myo-inositol-1(or 4)-monophosphatase